MPPSPSTVSMRYGPSCVPAFTAIKLLPYCHSRQVWKSIVSVQRGVFLRECRLGFDVIIIGAGHNGLVAAAYLAQAGRRVLVLERREVAGGCAVTEEVWPGYRVSTAAYLTSLLQERIVRELELPRYGYRVDAKDPAFFSVFPDGRHFFMWQDRA